MDGLEPGERTMTGGEPRISLAGCGAVLLDAAEGPFSPEIQRRVWAVAGRMREVEGVRDAVPGMNNLLIAFDALTIASREIRQILTSLWREVEPGDIAGRLVEVPVVYGGPRGEDLGAWAEHCRLPVPEAVRRHAAATYSVAAIGAMPGFPYLSGLDPALAMPRRASPRASVQEGAVIVGGAQAAIMPQTAPSGWHILGYTDVRLFDPAADPPTLLRPGDTIRFVVKAIEP